MSQVIKITTLNMGLKWGTVNCYLVKLDNDYL